MTGRITLSMTALLVALVGGQWLFAADAALEKTIERAKEKRQQDIDKAGSNYHAAVDRTNASLIRVLEAAIATAKRKGDDARVAALTADLELVKAGEAPTSEAGDDKLLEGATKRRVLDIEQADKSFKAAVDRANESMERTYKIAIASYERKKDARAEELKTELASAKAEVVSPVKSAASEPAVAKGNGSQKLIKDIGSDLVNMDGKKVTSETLASKDYVLVYYSASWCGPCRAFTPDLVKFHNDYAKKGNFEVILVSSDNSEDAMLKYMSGDKMPWLALPFDKGRSFPYAAEQGVSGIPHLALLDKNGNLISNARENGQYVGPRKVLADLKEKLGIR